MFWIGPPGPEGKRHVGAESSHVGPGDLRQPREDTGGLEPPPGFWPLCGYGGGGWLEAPIDRKPCSMCENKLRRLRKKRANGDSYALAKDGDVAQAAGACSHLVTGDGADARFGCSKKPVLPMWAPRKPLKIFPAGTQPTCSMCLGEPRRKAPEPAPPEVKVGDRVRAEGIRVGGEVEGVSGGRAFVKFPAAEIWIPFRLLEVSK